MEISDSRINHYQGKVAIESRINSPLEGEWPELSISTVHIKGNWLVYFLYQTKQRNSKCYKIKTSCYYAQSGITIISSLNKQNWTTIQKCDYQNELPFSSTTNVDTDNLCAPEEKRRFVQINNSFNKIFDPQFRVYNDCSSRIWSKRNLGQIIPPLCKAKLPLYTQFQLKLLQEEAN